MIEPEQHEVAGPSAGDTDGERPDHLARADGRGGIVDEFDGWLPHDLTLQLQQARIELPG